MEEAVEWVGVHQLNEAILRSMVDAGVVHEIEGRTLFNWWKTTGGGEFSRLAVWCRECNSATRGRLKGHFNLADSMLECPVCGHVICPARQVPPTKVLFWVSDDPMPPAPPPKLKESSDLIAFASATRTTEERFREREAIARPQRLAPAARTCIGTTRRFGAFGDKDR